MIIQNLKFKIQNSGSRQRWLQKFFILPPLASLALGGIFAFLILWAPTALAQGSFTGDLDKITKGVDSASKLINLAGGLACYFIRFGIIAAGIAIIIYGILFLKSRGSAQEFGAAKKGLAWAIVGVLVIFGVFTIILSVAGIIGVSYPILDMVKCP